MPVDRVESGISPSLLNIRDMMRDFADARDWNQFHTPRNLLLAMTGEVGEVAELFQWKGDAQCKTGLPDWTETEKGNLRDELADVQLYLARLADVCGVNLPEAVHAKMQKNKAKYPVELCKGKSDKYTAYQTLKRKHGERKDTSSSSPSSSPSSSSSSSSSPTSDNDALVIEYHSQEGNASSKRQKTEKPAMENISLDMRVNNIQKTTPLKMGRTQRFNSVVNYVRRTFRTNDVTLTCRGVVLDHKR
jgi:dCTP diphosphatase